MRWLAISLVLAACGPRAEPEDAVGSTGTASSSSPTTADDGLGATITSAATTDAADDTTGAGTTGSSLDVGCSRRDCTILDEEDDGCDPGFKCTVSDVCGTAGEWSSRICVPIVPDPALPGEPCTVEGDPLSGHDTCAAHAYCWDIDPATMTGTCVEFCHGLSTYPFCDAAEGYGCLSVGLLSVCLPSCDPAAPECADGEVCIDGSYEGEQWVCVPADVPLG